MTEPSSNLSIVFLVVGRELGRFFRTWLGYVVMAMLLTITGLLYNAFSVGSTAKYSADVLGSFFEVASGTTMIAALFLSMRSIAEETQTGTYALLASSPLTEGQIVLAKWLAAYAMLVIYLACTLYMPLLVFVNGSVTLGHIAAGYLGLLALGAASTAIGIFGSAVARSQLLAIIVSSVTLVVLLILWLLARQVDGPLGEVVSWMALWHKHFRPFMDGTLATPHLVFYISVTVFFSVLARNVLERRRWRS